MGCDLPAEPQMEFVRKALGFFGGWTDKLSIFFCILELCKRDKIHAVIPQNDKSSHKELRLLLHCATMSQKENELCVIVD